MRVEISYEVLNESKIGRTLKYFMEFCSSYANEMKELAQFKANA